MDKDKIENFSTYYYLHFQPMLERVTSIYAEDVPVSAEDRRLLAFLKDDIEELLALFKEGKNE